MQLLLWFKEEKLALNLLVLFFKVRSEKEAYSQIK